MQAVAHPPFSVPPSCTTVIRPWNFNACVVSGCRNERDRLFGRSLANESAQCRIWRIVLNHVMIQIFSGLSSLAETLATCLAGFQTHDNGLVGIRGNISRDTGTIPME